MVVRAVLVATLLLPACGGDERPTATTTSTTSDGLTMALTWGALTSGSDVEWRFVVRNRSGAALSLTFPTGQDGELVLLGDDEAVAYRWSDGRVFAQAVRERELAAGAELRFSLAGTLDVAPGTYSLRATLLARPAPAPVVERVTVS